jgi:hypothetical protein
MLKIVLSTRKSGTGWSRCEAVHLYSGSIWFECRTDHRISQQVFSGVPLSLQTYISLVPWYRPRPLPFTSFLIDQSSYHPTLCSLKTENIIKYPINNNYSNNNTRKNNSRLCILQLPV